MEGTGVGWVSAACLLLLASAHASAVPVPDVSMNAPEDLRADYDEAADVVHLAWSTPDGMQESDVFYRVYVDGDLAMTVPQPMATIPAPDLVSLVQVTAADAMGESLPSEPVLAGKDAGLLTLLRLEDNHMCEPVGTGLNPEPPFVLQINWDCIWSMAHM